MKLDISMFSFEQPRTKLYMCWDQGQGSLEWSGVGFSTMKMTWLKSIGSKVREDRFLLGVSDDIETVLTKRQSLPRIKTFSCNNQ